MIEKAKVMQIAAKNLFIVGVGACNKGLEAMKQFILNLPAQQDNLAIVIVQPLLPEFEENFTFQIKTLFPYIEVLKTKNGQSPKPNTIYFTPADHTITLENNQFKVKRSPSGIDLELMIPNFLNSLAEEKKEKAIGVILSENRTVTDLSLQAIKKHNGLGILLKPNMFNALQFLKRNGSPADLILQADQMGAAIFNFMTYGKQAITPDVNLKKELETHKDLIISAFQSGQQKPQILLGKSQQVIAYNKSAADFTLQHLHLELKRGTKFQEIFPEKQFTDLYKEWEDALNGQVRAGELQLNTKSQELIKVNFSLYPLYLYSSKTGGISFCFTTHKHGKFSLPAELDTDDQLLKAAYETANVGIAICNQQGIIVKVNQSLASLTGYSTKDLTQKPFSYLFPKEKNFTLESFFPKKKLEQAIEYYEIPVKKKNGQYLEVALSCNTLSSDEQEPYYIIAFKDQSEHYKYKKLLQDTQTITKVGGWEFDLFTTEVTWTQQVYEIFEVPTTWKITYKNWKNFFDEPSQELFNHAFKEAVTNGTPFDLELQLNYTKKWVRATCNPTRNNQKTSRLLGTFQDISSIKKAEEDIKLLSTVAAQTNNGVIITSKKGIIKWVNEGFEKMTGFSSQDIIGKHISLCYIRGNINSSYFEEKFEAKSQFSSEILSYKKDGKPYWFHLEATPVFSVKNEIDYYILIKTDINDTKQTQQKLKDSNEYLHNLKLALDMTSMVISTTDTGKIKSVNKKYCQLFEIQENELLHHNYFQLAQNLFEEERFKEIIKSLRNGQAWRGELKTRTTSNREIWLDTHVIPFLDESQKLSQIYFISNDITDRIKAEEQKLAYAKQSMDILESITDAMLAIDKNWTITFVNKKAEKTIGKSKDELHGKHLWKEFSQAVETGIYQNFQNAMMEQREVHFEEYYQPQLAWLEFHVYPYEEGILVYFQNVNDRKIAEKRLQNSETNLREAQKIAQMGSWKYFPDTRKLKLSEELLNIINFNPKEQNALQELLPLINQSDRNALIKALAKTSVYKQGFNIDLSIHTANNEKNVNIIGKVVNNDNNQIHKVYGTLMDVTARKETENKLKESKEWFKTILNTSRDGIVVLHNNTIHYLNEAFLQLYGYQNHNELLGKKIDTINQYWHVQDDSSSVLDNSEIYVAKGKKKDGTTIDIEISSSTLQLNNKVYTIALIRDITGRKKAEQTLKQQNEELIKINAELDRFVYSASHDLRAPLASVLGLINLAQMEKEGSQKHQYFNLMTKSINKLDDFIREIINYSRNSRLDIQNEKINFTPIVDETIEGLSYIHGSDQIDKYIEINEPVDFYSDKGRIQIILNNIISNAIRYSCPHRRKPFLHITIQTSAEKAVLEISDNGKGIAEEHLPKIFNMFFRASHDSIGSGLGLYIVKETINKIKGKISVVSTLGQGTSFTIEIPNLGA
jgi:PAS domain S-box-containing protein